MKMQPHQKLTTQQAKTQMIKHHIRHVFKFSENQQQVEPE